MFYYFRQNNSGGSFDIDDEVHQNVFIEASSYKEANDIAEKIGIYFDGVSMGIDCDCCGDRWSRQSSDSDGESEPLIYEEPLKECGSVDNASAYVYYLDGTMKKMSSKTSL